LFTVKTKFSLKPLVELPLSNPCPFDWDREFKRHAPLEIEIGFGYGEFLLERAQSHPHRNLLGVEQNWERICKTLCAVDRVASQLPSFKNIRIVRMDVSLMLERFVARESIDCVFCFFPCPWPKRRHMRYRLFSKEFLILLNNRLKEQGTVKIVTDFYPYVEWILSENKETGFEVEIKTIPPQYNTKFERKWTLKGQTEFFELNLQKKSHIAISEKEGVSLKSYRLKEFDPRSFCFEDYKNKIAVIFKGMLFDASQQKAMVHLLVSEDNLIQHFWVTIVKKGEYWHIHKMDGQNVLPTEGLNLALELVYGAVKTVDLKKE